MRIVVTGALGHIGSALVRYLPLEFPDAEIVMIDNLHTQRYCSLFHLPKGDYTFIEADARTCKIPIADAVVHLAAYSEPHGDLDWGHNLAATLNVANQAQRVIFPSSASVLLQPFPHTPYAGMKMREEEWVRQATLQHTIFRLGNLFGPSPGMRFHTVVSKFCWQAVTGTQLSLWKTAIKQRRPYLDLIDVCRAICFAIKGEHFGTFNLVTQTATASDVIAHIETHMPVKLSITYDPTMQDDSQDIDAKPLEALGFKFAGDLAQGIKATLDLLRC